VSTRESGPTNAHKVNFQLVIDALASGTSTLFYCHCHTDLARAGTAALVLSDQTELAVGEIAQLDLRRLESLTLVACASGQPNPFVGPISVAHAAALAGVRQLVFSLWPITAAHGARFVAGLLDDLASGGTTPDYLAALHITSPLRAAPFGVMRR
jgi:CHAT domain-containing protein